MKISVIIPVYNEEKHINRCLDSVITQTYNDWEIIAIDDGSNDNSYSVLNEYAVQNPEKFHVSTQKNQGAGLTRNTAISQAEGDFIVFLDADDYIEPDYFNDLVTCVNENNSDVVFIDILQETSSGEIIKAEKMSKYKNYSKETMIRHQMTGKLPWGGVRKAIKASMIHHNKIQYSKDVVGEEALFSFMVLYYAERISFLERPYYHYINYPNSLSKKGDEDPWGGVCKDLRDYLLANDIFEKYKATLNSFGLTAMIISIYRKAQKYSFLKTVRLSKMALKEFKETYGLNLDVDSLEDRIRFLLPLVKFNFVIPIVLIARLKFAFHQNKDL